MFTPQEVKEKSFPKATFGGFNIDAVEEFLEGVTEDYTTLYNENAKLKAQLKVLAEKVEEYRDTEEAMRSTLLAAQRMAAQMVKEAQDQKDQLLTEARAQNAAELQAMQDEVDAMRQKMTLAQQELNSFVDRSRELCRQQAEFFDRLPEMDMTVLHQLEQDVVAQAAQEIEEAVAEQVTEETPAEEQKTEESAPVQETPADEKEDEDSEIKAPPFPTFQLNMDDLKFGRNYNGEE